MIHEIEKTHAPRNNKGINPLRKSARELGFLLKDLSESVRGAKRYNEDADSIETPYSGASRNFKLKSAIEDDARESTPLPFKLNFNEEQTQTLNLLKEARTLAADASLNGLSENERNALAERFETVFQELGGQYSQTFASLQKEKEAAADEAKTKETPRFSLSTHQNAASTFSDIEEMIVKLFELGARRQDEQSGGNSGKTLSPGQSALLACNQIRELFQTEGGAKTFSRFQEIDRSNVIGLLE